MANIIGAGSYDPRSTQEKYLDTLRKYAPQMKQADGTSLTAQALQNATHLNNTNTPGIEAVKEAYGIQTVSTPKVNIPQVEQQVKVVNPPIQQANSLNSFVQQAVQPSYDIAGEIQRLKNAKLKRQLGVLAGARDKTLSGLTAEKSTIAPQYYDKGNQARVQSANSGRSFSEFLAQRGLSSSGVAAEGMMRNQGVLQGNLGQLNRQEQSAYDDIARRVSDANTEYEQSAANADADAELFAAQQMLDELNRQRDYARDDARYADSRSDVMYNRAYQTGRDAVGDNRYNQEYADNRTDVQYNRNYQQGRDAISDQRYGTEYADKQKTQNLENQYMQQQILTQKYANEAQAAKNKYAPQLALSQYQEQVYNTAYEKAKAAGYSQELAATIAVKQAQKENYENEAANRSTKTNYDVNKPYYNPNTKSGSKSGSTTSKPWYMQ